VKAAYAVALAAALVAVLCAGLWLGGHPSDLPQPLRDVFVDESTTLSGEAAETIEDKYFRGVSRSDLNDASIRGMIAAIRHRHKEDRYSQYLDPDQAKTLDEQTSGKFTGVGLSVGEVKQGLSVSQVFKGSPAAKAGIEPGDLIVSVNGNSIAGKPSLVSTAKIKGEAGTKVTLGVQRKPGAATREVKVERAEITSPVVEPKLKSFDGEKLGYVAFGGPDLATSFSEGAHGALREAVEKLEGEGAQGILLDLRGNPGGLLNEAVLTASVFLPKGEKVVSTKSRSEGKRIFLAAGDPVPRRPIVVLIDRGTASAAEILASALIDHGLATAVGTRSFGKGLFQDVLSLPNGGELDLSVGEFFTANGISLAPQGIHPSIKATDDPKTKKRDEALQRGLQALAAKVSGGGSGAAK
jgi:carboxyl-terminal processing protease